MQSAMWFTHIGARNDLPSNNDGSNLASGNAGRLERVSPTWSDKNGRAKRPSHVTKEKKRYPSRLLPARNQN